MDSLYQFFNYESEFGFQNDIFGFKPDFAEFIINYVPDKLCVELKSIKLYMSSFRDVGAFHEDNTNNILKDISTLIKPRYISVIGYWKVRGGIITTITTKNIKNGWKDKNNILI